ncbi:potassium transporter 26-like [Diospyros lotus]|uniref:potassium transporter 26-like n=1 Tax=Diospyros lotus TaxID=55363 RepID=UPI00225091E7|nr:potassium transporter 26-like [Diospyros lotus]
MLLIKLWHKAAAQRASERARQWESARRCSSILPALAFSTFVYPVLVFTYGGQIPYLIKHPDQISTAFYNAIPKPVYWPMFVVATLAATVASQAMVSASYSVVKQSLALGCFPRVNVKHTSSKHEGQVYLPEINYILVIICISLVVGFRDGVQIGNAYGVVIIWVMIITTFLVTLVILVTWDLNVFLTIAFFVPFVLIEGAFVISLLEKIPQGGWVPFAISAFFMVIMLSWTTTGRSRKNAYDIERMMKADELNQMLSRSSSSSLHRSPGICFFCADLVNGIPTIIRHYIQHTNSVREIMIIVTVRTLPIKMVLPEERLDVGKLGGIEGIYRCLVQYGYKDPTNPERDDFVASVADGSAEARGWKAHGAVFVPGRTILKSKESNGWFSHLINRRPPSLLPKEFEVCCFSNCLQGRQYRLECSMKSKTT